MYILFQSNWGFCSWQDHEEINALTFLWHLLSNPCGIFSYTQYQDIIVSCRVAIEVTLQRFVESSIVDQGWVVIIVLTTSWVLNPIPHTHTWVLTTSCSKISNLAKLPSVLTFDPKIWNKFRTCFILGGPCCLQRPSRQDGT